MRAGCYFLYSHFINSRNLKLKIPIHHIDRSKRGRQGCNPPLGPKFSHFHAFCGKKFQNNRLAHPIWELAPPLGKIPDPSLHHFILQIISRNNKSSKLKVYLFLQYSEAPVANFPWIRHSLAQNLLVSIHKTQKE